MSEHTEVPLPVLIVGGGIGGLAAALAFSRKGVPSLVLEQSAEFGEIGAGIQLGPNVFRMFERLGISEQASANRRLRQGPHHDGQLER